VIRRSPAPSTFHAGGDQRNAEPAGLEDCVIGGGAAADADGAPRGAADTLGAGVAGGGVTLADALAVALAEAATGGGAAWTSPMNDSRSALLAA